MNLSYYGKDSRFIAEQQCGDRDAELFESVMHTACEYNEQTDDFTLLSIGERRYGNALFSFCALALRTGKQGRAQKVLPPKVKVRIKNKGNQKIKNGRNLPKYRAPIPEHPDTNQNLSETDIHTNHIEAYNTSLRRWNSAFRRRTNTYAKTRTGLQKTLDVLMLIHNFVRPDWTTGDVPAVALEIFRSPLGFESILKMHQYA